MAAYNEFARQFNCQVFSPERLYWKQDLPLEGGVLLRIHGLTSTLLSGADGQDDTRTRLYLSPLQTVLDPTDNVVNLVMCHHPPEWFMDCDDVDDAMCGRAAIHLFGHKHRQRSVNATNYIQFSAGAVNPDRNEQGWQPGYNLIELHVTGEGERRALEIKAHLLEWQSNPDLFRPKLTPNGEAVLHHRINIPDRTQTVVQSREPRSVPVEEPYVALEAESDVEAAMGEKDTRNLVFRFWNLTVSQRREITLRMGLIEESEMSLPEPERYGRALLRASERGLLEKLAHEIEQVEKQ